jgi:peptidoglycan/LPS O-acetylase OafA/YrhL
LKYRSDIDGLRAIAVLSVIAFHSGIVTLSGGYIGVDIFFVISGYLITTLIYKEIQNDTFTFRGFYKRRAARLLPALSITLSMVLIFGFIFYNNKTFDNLGKELFFSSFGAANILFAQGINYFAKDEAYQPLIHLWSLGVEEQFYIIWPILLILAFKVSKKTIITITYALFLASLALSVIAVDEGLTKGYFLLQYRAFELLIGVITALHLQHAQAKNVADKVKQILSYIGMILIISPMFILNENSNFPGYNALWPCLGTALIIAFPNQGLTTKLLSHKVLVFIGLISYPLYLFHQPIISFIYFFNFKLTPFETLSLVTSIAVLASWITYKFIEIPIRRLAHSKKRKESFFVFGALCSTIPLFAILGLGIAKSNGFEERFRYLNPFALEVSQAHATSFHENFERGYKVSPARHSTALFVGDSVLQHYVLPMKKALNLEFEDIDTVTRGGCVLLKNVDFVEKFSDISCNEIRDKLYSDKKKYDYVVISQAWGSYGTSVLNFSTSTDKYERWLPLLDSTIEHFLTIADNVIIIGAHLSVEGTLNIQPSVTITKDSLLLSLKDLKVNNINDLKDSHKFFVKFKENERVNIIEPYRIFCDVQCKLHDNNWSYFSDNLHVSNAATDFITMRMLDIMSK